MTDRWNYHNAGERTVRPWDGPRTPPVADELSEDEWIAKRLAVKQYRATHTWDGREIPPNIPPRKRRRRRKPLAA